jgi:hypothetical protein
MDEVSLINRPTAEPEPEAILPRSAWFSQLAQLRITLQAKQVLDQQDIKPYLCEQDFSWK